MSQPSQKRDHVFWIFMAVVWVVIGFIIWNSDGRSASPPAVPTTTPKSDRVFAPNPVYAPSTNAPRTTQAATSIAQAPRSTTDYGRLPLGNARLDRLDDPKPPLILNGGQSNYRTLPDSQIDRQSGYKPFIAENGTYYGQLNDNSIPKTVHVGGYLRRDGTYVRGHYRSPPGSNPRRR